MSINKLHLSRTEIDSTAWQKATAFWKRELEEMRARLEALNITDEQRREAAIRVNQIKRFLDVHNTSTETPGAG